MLVYISVAFQSWQVQNRNLQSVPRSVPHSDSHLSETHFLKMKIQESKPWTPPSLRLSFPSHPVQSMHKFHSATCNIFLHADPFPPFPQLTPWARPPVSCLLTHVSPSTFCSPHSSQVSLLGLTSDHGTPQLKAFHSEWIIAIHNPDKCHKHEVEWKKPDPRADCMIPLHGVQNQERVICY